jgi:thiol-disulfide isomerase/thioredoxin
MRLKLIIGALTIASLLGCSNTNNAGERTAYKSFTEGIELTDLVGNPIDLSGLKGKRIILNVWATWCKPCIQEMPSLEELQKSLPEDKYIILLASSEGLDKIKKFKERNSYTLEFVQLITTQESLGIYSLPTTFIIDEKGKLLITENGMRDWGDHEVIKEIEQL